VTPDGNATLWKIHREQVVDTTRRLQLSIASVELPGEEPAVTAAREVEEETGWRPRTVEPLVSLQPSVGTTDAENLLFVSYGADHIGQPTDINEAERIEWIRLDSIRTRITTGEIIGAASLVGLLHVLAYTN
jgi:8-oxo-dGDP phosphatase